MIGGQIKATILDPANTALVMEKAPGKFHLLPGPDLSPTNEGLFAHQDWMKAHPEAVAVITEEFLKLYREMKDQSRQSSPRSARSAACSPDQPKVTKPTRSPTFGQAIGLEGRKSVESRGRQRGDRPGRRRLLRHLRVRSKGTPDDLKLEVSDFWDLAPLEAAKKKLGG